MPIRKFEPSRTIEVIVPRYGSGYRIGGRLVLTAAHLLDNVGSDCEVRDKRSFGEEKAQVVWKAQGLDIALIELPEKIAGVEAITLGKLPEATAGEKLAFQMYAYPSWARTQREQGSAAGGRQIEGIIYLSDRSPDGLLVLEAERLPPEVTTVQSEWEGASGAAINCDGLVIAVQMQHQNPRRPASLEATPLWKVYEDEQWRQCLKKHGINSEPEIVGESNSKSANNPPNGLSFQKIINEPIVPKLVVQKGDGYFVGGTDAVRRGALTLLDPTWDGNLIVHCGHIEAWEAELRELESLALCSEEQGNRIISLRESLAYGRWNIAKVIAALRLTFMDAPGRERKWGTSMKLEDATIFIENLFAYAQLAAGQDDWAKCWVYLPAFNYYRTEFITRVFMPNTVKQEASSEWCDALSCDPMLTRDWNEVLPVLAFHNEPIARYLLPAIVFRIVPSSLAAVDKVTSITDFWVKLAELKPPENDRDPLNPFDWCVALNPDITTDDIRWRLSTPPKSIPYLETYLEQMRKM